MELIIVTGVVIAVVVVGVVLVAAALRSMRPQAPEAQTYTPAPAAARSAPATSTATPKSGLTPQVVAEIDRLIGAGQKIKAIKAYRTHTGVGLAEAKDRIDHWSISTTAPHTAAVSHASAASSSATASPSSVRASLPASVASDIDRLVAGNQKIAAIKTLREHTRFGLGDAKDVIDRWPTAPRS